MSMRRNLSASIALALMLTMLMTLTASAQEVVLGGSANFRDADAMSDSLVVDLDSAAVLSPGSQYEGWLIDIAGNKVSTGVYGRDSEPIGTYVSPDGENLLARYPTFVLTIEPNPDSDPEPSGEIAYGDSVPIAVSYWSNKLTGEGGPASGMYSQAQMANDYAMSAQEEDLSLDEQKVIAQSIINLIEGVSGANYNAEGANPGDGRGIMGHAPDVRDMARTAKNAANDDEDIEDTADDIVTAADRTVGEARRVRDVALRIINATTQDLRVAKEVENLLSLSSRVLYGENGPGSSNSVGGARTVYHKSQDLSQFKLGFGEPPAAGDSTVSLLAILALAAGSALVIGGGLLVFRGRRVAA